MGHDHWYLVIALFDTQADGIWVCGDIVTKFNKWPSVTRSSRVVKCARGEPIKSSGLIELQWVWADNDASTTHTDVFDIMAEGKFDIIFGSKFLIDHGLLPINKGRMFMLRSGGAITKGS
jgi:hypothetical protein